MEMRTSCGSSHLILARRSILCLRILVSKLRDVDINPYILNWLNSFISNRKQRVLVDNITTEFIDITRGVPQGTVLGPILFSLMINDIKPFSPSSLLVKFADDITVSIPVRAEDGNIAESEVSSIMEWAEKNQMTLNLNKTWEMLLKSGSLKVPPAPLAIVERKTKLKLLGVTFEDDPVNWDSHIDHELGKASSRMYILRVCRFYGYPKEQLDLLFQSLIISVFTYAIEVWGCCYYDKYLKRIDKLFARAFKSGYCLKKYSICDILATRDGKLRSLQISLYLMIFYRRDILGNYAAGAMIIYYLEFILHILNPLLYIDIFLALSAINS